jgi:alpha-1,3-glucosyltransferase
LCFKQISLYYAPAFFFFLLGQAWAHGRQHRSVARFVARVAALGVVVVATVAICFMPWITRAVAERSLEPVLQVLHRVFPFSRGLYEDKVRPHLCYATSPQGYPHKHSNFPQVANFWCVSGFVFKWHQRLEAPTLLRLCTGATVVGCLPSGLRVLLRPTPRGFLYALATSSFSFFLFSFQVHEKSILFPLLPTLCLGLVHPLLAKWVATVAAFSMFPLLQKDGLTLQYIALQVFFLYASRSLDLTPPPKPSTPADVSSPALSESRVPFILSMLSMVGVHGIAFLLGRFKAIASVGGHPWLSPAVARFLTRYPDLDLYIFAALSAAHFLAFYIALVLSHYRDQDKAEASPKPKTE